MQSTIKVKRSWNETIFQGSSISAEFDILRYVSIFPTSSGHNLGTKSQKEPKRRSASLAGPLSRGRGGQ
jgi:hypothetical protein